MSVLMGFNGDIFVQKVLRGSIICTLYKKYFFFKKMTVKY